MEENFKKMDEKTLAALEYFKIRDATADLCISEDGAALIRSSLPLGAEEAEQIAQRKSLAEDALRYVGAGRQDALESWEPVGRQLLSLEKKSAMDRAEIFSLGRLCLSAGKFQAQVRAASETLELKYLLDFAGTIPSLEEPEREIFRVLGKDGEFRALPELLEIQDKIASLRREIGQLMRRHVSDPRTAAALQDTVPALKGERQVLAVRSDRRNAVAGIVHEVSRSGQTVFIEPEDVVRKNNELVEEEFHLVQAENKILFELVQKIAQFKDEFALAAGILARADAAFAAARQCVLWKGVFPRECRQGEPPQILSGRHPLLGAAAVPVTVRFERGRNILVLTGPNTGGKTVCAKMLLLFAALHQSGLPIPAEEGSALPLCSGIFADIGDEQDISQNLSTFSAHIRNIARILKKSDSSTLVLLDEPGSGTDPQEGSAIAMAALDSLARSGAFALVTTHHGALKDYAFSSGSCQNASVEFDPDSGRPTYQIRMGVPGESHAIEIAEAAGFPPDALAAARSYLANRQADVSALISGLTRKHEELDSRLEGLSEREEKFRLKEEKLQLRLAEFQRRELEQKERELRAENAFVSEARKELENLVRLVREGELTKEKTGRVRQFIEKIGKQAEEDRRELSSLEAAFEKQEAEIEEHRHKSKKARHRTKNKDTLLSAKPYAGAPAQGGNPPEIPEIAPGVEVLAGREKRSGVVVARAGRGEWQVQLGSIRMTFKEKDLRAVPQGPAPKGEVKFEGASTFVAEERPAYELRLMGLRADEAVRLLQRQLDLCLLSGMRNFSVIHGKGDGILQQAVHDYLSHYPAVSEFSFARPEEGGTGKTYVVMRD